MDASKISLDRLKKHWFGICILLILFLATFLRFYNYENRWGLAYDQAHDALVARYALEHHKIPLVGPFSSAGPFQTGGEWYWIIMAAYAIYPHSVLSPWIAITLISLVFVFVAILVGSEIAGKGFGILLGMLSTVSTGQIAQSVSLTNQSPLALVSLLAIWSMVRFAKTKSDRYLFFLALSVTLAASIHLQGISLVLLIVTTLLFFGVRTKRSFLMIILGILIPIIPLIIFDLKNDFVNSRGFLQYVIYDQYKIPFEALGRRWLTYLGVFWPNAWSHVIGGIREVAYIQILSLVFVFLYGLYRKSISKIWLTIAVTFLLMVVLLRYTRTPLFDSYIVFLHPFILLLTGWA
ncbi:MAG: glycosyltransferase family 39 protein, partial [Patescibacteria group bacterium]